MKQVRFLWKGIGTLMILALLIATLAWPGSVAGQAQSVQDAEPEWYQPLPPWQPCVRAAPPC